jgi:hypothetical protein
MTYTRMLMAVVAAAVVTTFTDWLFMGILFHRKYLAFPEVWRKKPGEPDAGLIAWSQVVSLVSCAAFVLVCARFRVEAWSTLLKLAAAGWAMGPLPILIQNGLWTKIHPQITVAHSAGWLVRFLVYAVAVKLLLP